MRLCSHVVTCDSGLAPNPFHGYCTSAVCTPSHMNARLEKCEWLADCARQTKNQEQGDREPKSHSGAETQSCGRGCR
jgi:hypothetical protein